MTSVEYSGGTYSNGTKGIKIAKNASTLLGKFIGKPGYRKISYAELIILNSDPIPV